MWLRGNKMKKRVAALDIGSNSVRLLVADSEGDELHTITKERRVTRLFAGLENGLLHPESIRRTADAVRELAHIAREQGAEEVLAFGTSAMREGENREELIALVRLDNVEIIVLSGEEEAKMAYRGAAPDGKAGVLDIGGGSTEMIVGENGEMRAGASAPVGAVRLYQQMSAIQPSPRALIALAKERIVAAGGETILDFTPDWVAVGGTVTTLAAMLLQLEPYDDSKVHGVRITAQAAKGWLDMLWAMPVHLRAQLKGLDPKRADIMPCGIAILIAFFEAAGIDGVAVSAADNLTGFLRSRTLG